MVRPSGSGRPGRASRRPRNLRKMPKGVQTPSPISRASLIPERAETITRDSHSEALLGFVAHPGTEQIRINALVTGEDREDDKNIFQYLLGQPTVSWELILVLLRWAAEVAVPRRLTAANALSQVAPDMILVALNAVEITGSTLTEEDIKTTVYSLGVIGNLLEWAKSDLQDTRRVATVNAFSSRLTVVNSLLQVALMDELIPTMQSRRSRRLFYSAISDLFAEAIPGLLFVPSLRAAIESLNLVQTASQSLNAAVAALIEAATPPVPTPLDRAPEDPSWTGQDVLVAGFIPFIAAAQDAGLPLIEGTPRSLLADLIASTLRAAPTEISTIVAGAQVLGELKARGESTKLSADDRAWLRSLADNLGIAKIEQPDKDRPEKYLDADEFLVSRLAEASRENLATSTPPSAVLLCSLLEEASRDASVGGDYSDYTAALLEVSGAAICRLRTSGMALVAADASDVLFSGDLRRLELCQRTIAGTVRTCQIEEHMVRSILEQTHAAIETFSNLLPSMMHELSSHGPSIIAIIDLVYLMVSNLATSLCLFISTPDAQEGQNRLYAAIASAITQGVLCEMDVKKGFEAIGQFLRVTLYLDDSIIWSSPTEVNLSDFGYLSAYEDTFGVTDGLEEVKPIARTGATLGLAQLISLLMLHAYWTASVNVQLIPSSRGPEWNKMRVIVMAFLFDGLFGSTAESNLINLSNSKRPDHDPLIALRALRVVCQAEFLDLLMTVYNDEEDATLFSELFSSLKPNGPDGPAALTVAALIQKRLKLGHGGSNFRHEELRNTLERIPPLFGGDYKEDITVSLRQAQAFLQFVVDNRPKNLDNIKDI